jgi:hypothetical protein
MWKFVLVLLLTAITTLIAQLIVDAPVIPDADRYGGSGAFDLRRCRGAGVTR